jgi:hypothetical protein
MARVRKDLPSSRVGTFPYVDFHRSRSSSKKWILVDDGKVFRLFSVGVGIAKSAGGAPTKAGFEARRGDCACSIRFRCEGSGIYLASAASTHYTR